MFDKRSDALLSAANATTYLTEEGLQALRLFQRELDTGVEELDIKDPVSTAYFVKQYPQLSALLQLIIDRLAHAVETIKTAANTFEKGGELV